MVAIHGSDLTAAPAAGAHRFDLGDARHATRFEETKSVKPIILRGAEFGEFAGHKIDVDHPVAIGRGAQVLDDFSENFKMVLIHGVR